MAAIATELLLHQPDQPLMVKYRPNPDSNSD